MNSEIAEFLGWYFGDGCLSTKNGRYQFSITGDLREELLFYQKTIIPRINTLFGSIINKEVKLKEYKSVGVCGVYFSSKDFVRILQNNYNIKGGKKLNVNLPDLKTKKQKKYFLRGLFDTDGSIYFSRSHYKTKIPTFCNTYHYKPIIKLATISKNLIGYVYETLKELGYSPRLYKPTRLRKHENILHSVVLDINDDVKRWIDEVGFKNPKHNTKIEVWKKFGFCPPYTKIKDRISLIDNKISPFEYYDVKKEKNL
jgi:hypothetical protein